MLSQWHQKLKSVSEMKDFSDHFSAPVVKFTDFQAEGKHVVDLFQSNVANVQGQTT